MTAISRGHPLKSLSEINEITLEVVNSIATCVTNAKPSIPELAECLQKALSAEPINLVISKDQTFRLDALCS